jgi:hypothetical protein
MKRVLAPQNLPGAEIRKNGAVYAPYHAAMLYRGGVKRIPVGLKANKEKEK